MHFLQQAATYSDFRSAIAKLAWILHTRQDIIYAVAQQ